MSEVMRLCGDADPVKCDACGWTGRGEQLGLMPDFEERVAAGETVPAGACPECDCLAHLTAPAEAHEKRETEIADLTTVARSTLKMLCKLRDRGTIGDAPEIRLLATVLKPFRN